MYTQVNQDVEFLSCWDPKSDDTPNGGVQLVLLDIDTVSIPWQNVRARWCFRKLKADLPTEDFVKRIATQGRYVCCT
jgi:hypothetical protein